MKKLVKEGRWIKIYKTDGEYVFKTYPRNDKNQRLGTSRAYSSFEECEEASKKFIRFILENEINNSDSQYIILEQEKDARGCWRYRYVCNDENGQPFFYQRYVGNKTNSKKGVISIYNTLEKAYRR